MIAQPFLTDLDSRAEVKGSVDPLGAMAIWTRLGRRVVGNLSTVTSSVKDFKTLVLGFALIEDLRRQAGENDIDELGIFLRWEQLAAYTRARDRDYQFRGTTRARRTLSEGDTVPLSTERDCQILGNQKVYGLWGLFTVPARACGLLEPESNALTAEAKAFVDGSWRRTLVAVWPRLLLLVGKDNRRVNLERHEDVLKKLRDVWRKTTAVETSFWTKHLVRGGAGDRTEGRQAILADLLRGFGPPDEQPLSPSLVHALAAKAREKDVRLADDLLDIAACDSILAPSSAVFTFLQTRDRQALDVVASSLEARWLSGATVEVRRLERLVQDFCQAADSEVIAALWQSLAGDFRDKRYRAVLEHLLEINKLVMANRGGAPWVSCENGIIRVKFRDESSPLPPDEDLKELWRFPYFINSLRTVVHALGAN